MRITKWEKPLVCASVNGKTSTDKDIQNAINYLAELEDKLESRELQFVASKKLVPKYKVGDRVYYIDYRFYVDRFTPVVDNDVVRKVYAGTKTVTYYIGRHRISRHEDKVFATYEECKKLLLEQLRKAKKH